MLHTISSGEPTDKPPLLIAHGLFGSARNWGVIGKRLSESRQVIAVDMRNHGGSFWDDSHSYADLATDLADVIAAHGGQADVIGHSMGGKAAMMLALAHPECVNRAVIADIAPVAYDHSQAHLIAAMRAVDLTHVDKRSDAGAQLAALVDDTETRAFLLQSLDIAAQKWRLNLDVLDRDMADITGWPDPVGTAPHPILFLSGAQSDYVRPQHRALIRAHFPNARFAKIPGAGHWLHAEKPREFEAAVRVFLET